MNEQPDIRYLGFSPTWHRSSVQENPYATLNSVTPSPCASLSWEGSFDIGCAAPDSDLPDDGCFDNVGHLKLPFPQDRYKVWGWNKIFMCGSCKLWLLFWLYRLQWSAPCSNSQLMQTSESSTLASQKLSKLKLFHFFFVTSCEISGKPNQIFSIYWPHRPTVMPRTVRTTEV